jgi:tight adherence protein B
MVIALLTFALTLLIVLGSYWFLVVRPERRLSRTLRERIEVKTQRTIGSESVVKGLPGQAQGGPLGTVLTWYRRYTVAATARLIDSAGLRTDPHWLIGGTAIALTFVFAAVQLAHAGPLVAAIAGGATPLVPYFYIRRLAWSRLNALEEMFPEAVTLMARALRAGHALTTTLTMVADELDEPIKSEFAALYEQHNYGLPMTQVMRTFATRVPLMDVRFFCIAVLTQRETGGNLAEVLDNLANVMRERFRVRRQLRVLTAQGRMTGWMLGVLPLVLGAILYMLNPQQMHEFIADPTGVQLFELAIGLQIVGLVAIRKILQVDY